MPKRARWPGFVLTDSPQDEAIDQWLDEAAANGTNVSKVVKDHLYRVATGEFSDPSMQAIIDRLDKLDEISNELSELRRELRRIAASGLAAAPTQRELPTEDKRAEAKKRLSSMPD